MTRYPGAVAVSALTGEGLAELAVAVSDALSRGFIDADIEMNVANGRLMAYLAANGEVLSRQFQEDRVTIHCRIPEHHLAKVHGEDVEVRRRGASGLRDEDLRVGEPIDSPTATDEEDAA